MTLDDVERIPKDFLTVTDIAPFLHSSPNDLRVQAWERPDMLGFPIVIVRRRIKIPKALFVQHFRGRNQPGEAVS